VEGKNYRVQTNTVPDNGYADASPLIAIPGSNESTTNWLDAGGITNLPSRFYRIRLANP
jgi:hypothetical protein